MIKLRLLKKIFQEYIILLTLQKQLKALANEPSRHSIILVPILYTEARIKWKNMFFLRAQINDL